MTWAQVIQWAHHHEVLAFIIVIIAINAIGWPYRAAIERTEKKRKHELTIKQMELQAAQAKSAALPAVAQKDPGQCKHRQVVSIRRKPDDELVGWLCRSCDRQLPPDWAVDEEDL